MALFRRSFGWLYDTEDPIECLTSSLASLVVRFCDGEGHVGVERLRWHCFGGRLYDTEEPIECLTSSSASLVVRCCSRHRWLSAVVVGIVGCPLLSS